MLSSLAMLILVLVLPFVGFISGVTIGFFGVGAGLVLVPTLALIFPYFGASIETDIVLAVGTSLALLVPGAGFSLYQHTKLAHVDFRQLAYWIPFVILGIILSAWVHQLINLYYLKYFFLCYLFVCLAIACLSPAVEPPSGGRNAPPMAFMRYMVAVVVGCVASLLGIGGGTMTIPFFRAYGYPIKKTAAVSSATACCVGIGGALMSIYSGWGVMHRVIGSLGYVNLPAVLLITPIMYYASPLGVRLAAGCSHAALVVYYRLFLCCIIVEMMLKLVFHVQ